MAVLDRFKKQPNEVKKYQIDYTEWLSTDETIIAVTQSVATLNPASTDVGEPTLTVGTTNIIESGTKYEYYLSSGTDGKRYKITFLSDTSDAQTLESEIEFTVNDI